MPALAAAPLLYTAIAGAAGAGATAAAGIYGANKQSSAANNAAKLQTDAANQAAQLQSKSAADALAFQKDQAAQDLATTNATQKANYDQWAAREGRLSNFGQALGLAPRNTPAYQPLPNTLGSTQTAPNAGTMPTGQQPTGNLSDPKAWMSLVGNDQALSQWVSQGLGAAAQKPGLVDYYVKTIKGQPGANAEEQAGSAAYYQNLFAKDPNVTGRATAAPAANSMQSALSAQPSVAPMLPITPALQAPTPYNSFASFLQQ